MQVFRIALVDGTDAVALLTEHLKRRSRPLRETSDKPNDQLTNIY